MGLLYFRYKIKREEGKSQKDKILNELAADSTFLQKNGFMNYSLLLGIERAMNVRKRFTSREDLTL